MKWAFTIILSVMILALVIRNCSTVKRYFNTYFKWMIWLLLVAGIMFGSALIHEGRLGLKAFFEDYRNVFTGIGYSAVAVGLFLTVLQLRDAKKKAKASFSYQVYKDGRELMKSLDNMVRGFVESEDTKGYTPKNRWVAEAKIGEVLQYYASVYDQWAYFQNIEERDWLCIQDEFCGFLKNPQVQAYWETKIKNCEAWDVGFRSVGQRCLDQKHDC